MVTERAIVIRCQDGHAEVELQRNSACGHCEVAQGCGTGAIGRLLGNRKKPISIETRRQLSPGDEVILNVSERDVVKASFLIYGLPLIGLLISAVSTHILFSWPEWAVVVTSIAGFWAGCKLARQMTGTFTRNSFSMDIVDIQTNPARSPES